MFSIYPANFSEIVQRVSEKFTIVRGFLFVGTSGDHIFVCPGRPRHFLSEFGLWLPQMASERKKVVGGILKASMTSIHPESFSKITPMVFGKFAIARSFSFLFFFFSRVSCDSLALTIYLKNGVLRHTKIWF